MSCMNHTSSGCGANHNQEDRFIKNLEDNIDELKNGLTPEQQKEFDYLAFKKAVDLVNMFGSPGTPGTEDLKERLPDVYQEVIKKTKG